jgi:hypothetical protein
MVEAEKFISNSKFMSDDEYRVLVRRNQSGRLLQVNEVQHGVVIDREQLYSQRN